ncbi:peptidase domain-containing ABC transporter [Caenispirillum salinarum]|uniref:peptidase domain-containing ABC transporter n=1 Tax=Caenispirillum salinarum TaxID=859058 RepID=UPI00384ABB35
MADDDTAASWLRPVLKPLRPAFLEVLTLSFFANLLATAVPIFTLQVYDRVVFHNGLSTLQGLVAGMVLVLAFDFVLRQTRSRVLQRVALTIDAKVGRRLFDKITALPLRTLESRRTAFWQGIFRDLDTVRNTLSGATVVLLVDLPFVVLFVGLVYVIAAPVAWVLLIAFGAFLLLAAWSAATMAKAAKAEKDKAARRDLLVAETIQGRATVKALALHRHLRPRWEDLQADTIGRSIDRGLRNDGYVNLAHVMTMATTVAMTTVGALAIMEQEMTIGALIAANMLSGRMMGPMNQVVGAWRSYAGFRQSAARLGKLFGEAEERMTPGIAHDRPAGRLGLDGVCFRYRKDGQPVIDGARADVPPGGITCLMGRNGSGKTTLAKLLTGLYQPGEGRVLLDGADMAQFSREELATWIGYVPQETVLLSGSIRDAIAQGTVAGEADDEAIITAAKRGCVHDIIMDMPDGYDTDVGEAGALLAGGVRQRIAIARALVTDPPVIIMDEPSSHLDTQAEQTLARSLAALAADRNIILVTHSPVLLNAARSIIVLERGRIAAGGPAGQVMAWLQGRGAPPGQGRADPPRTTEAKADGGVT